MWQGSYRRKVLLEDERNRGFPAVVGYGPYLFVSGSDGHRDVKTERIDPELYDKPVEQCRNAYGRVQLRLEKAGYSGECAVWIENFTSGLQWRLQRMALWPEYFGEEHHGYAVSFGAQSRLPGINMITACVMGVVPEVERKVAVKQPHRGRASRITRVGPLVFVIGVRGRDHPETKEPSPEETDAAFDIQFDNCLTAIKGHLAKDGTPYENMLRMDGVVRAARFVPPYLAGIRRHSGGRIPFANYAMGVPLGGRGEQEIGGVAAAPGEAREVFWSERDPTVADATRGGNLVFVRNISGLRDEATGALRSELFNDQRGQVRQALRNVERLLAKAGVGLDRLLRLDVFVRDIYAEDEIVAALKAELGAAIPTLNVIGAEPEHGAQIELVALAGGARD